eukprot:scaffold25839_cov66-Phaeocystis_antarctica.AAC.2
MGLESIARGNCEARFYIRSASEPRCGSGSGAAQWSSPRAHWAPTGHSRAPKTEEPSRTEFDPAATASSMSEVMPMLSSSSCSPTASRTATAWRQACSVAKQLCSSGPLNFGKQLMSLGARMVIRPCSFRPGHALATCAARSGAASADTPLPPS